MGDNEMNDTILEHFLNLIPRMDEKDIIDFIEANADDIMNNELLDTFVVRMVIAIGNKINIRDSDWATYYIKLASNSERAISRTAIYQLIT